MSLIGYVDVDCVGDQNDISNTYSNWTILSGHLITKRVRNKLWWPGLTQGIIKAMSNRLIIRV